MLIPQTLLTVDQ